MKKNIYSLFLAVIALAGFTACSDSDNDYQWASVPAGDQVYFSKDLPAKQNISNKTNSFTIPVNRVKTADAITVGVALTSDDNFFTAPSSVTFNAGEATANLTISYDGEALAYDDYKSVTLSISDNNYTTPYGASTYTFSAGAPSPFKTLGTGYYEENWFPASGAVTIAQNTENTNVFRVYGIADFYANEGGAERASEYMEITVCKPGDVFRDVTITQNDLVYFSDFNTGYYNTSNDYNKDIMIYHPSKFTNGSDENTWLHSRVLAHQEDGTPGQIQLGPRYYMDGVGGWNQSQNDGIIIITFPGFQPKDYTATLAAQGVFTDLSGNVFAQALAELGADATNVKAVVIEADADPEAVADAIAAGELEANDVEAGGIINVPIPEGMSGKLQIVLVVLDEEGAVKTVCASGFEYYGGAASPWQSLGIGLYTEDFIGSVFGADPVTYEVEIEENSETPGLYRMLSPYDGKFPYNEEGDWDATGVYNIEVNAEDPEGVYILPQATGVDWTYGPITICSLGGYYIDGGNSVEDVKAAGYLGTLVDGVITLPVIERDLSDGSKGIFQGYTFMGTSGYYAATNGAFKLVLPEAVSAQARAKAAKRAKAQKFARHLNAYSKKINKGFVNRLAPIKSDMMIAE